MGTYYDLLGLAPKASETEVRSAYARDLLGLQKTVSPEAARFRAALDEAFATLIDPQRRSAYDAELRRPKRKAPKAPKPPKAAKAEKPPKAAKAEKPPKAPNAMARAAQPGRHLLSPFAAMRRVVRMHHADVTAPRAERAVQAAAALEAPRAATAVTTVAAVTTPKAVKLAKTATAKSTNAAVAAPPDPLRQASGYARNAGLVFALGGLFSGFTYVYSKGTYMLAWGPLIVGVLGLAWWLVRYLRLPPAVRRPDHILLLGGLIMFGLVSAGWVGLSGTSR